MPSARARTLVVAVCAAALGVAAAPAQATFTAVAEDPAGDATVAEPGRDITAVGLGYSRTGRLAAALQLRGAPRDAPGFLTLVAATETAEGCGGQAVGLGADTDALDAQWYRFASPTEVTARGSADKRSSGDRVVRFEADDAKLAGLRPDCLLVLLTEPGNPQNVYDSVGPLRLVPQASLSLKLGGMSDTVRSGRTHRLKITVANPGDAPTGKVTVRIAKPPHATLAPRALTLRSIAAGGRRTATVDVTFSNRAPTANELRATVRAGRLTVRESFRVYVRRTPSESRGDRGGGGGGGSGGGQLGVCTRWVPDLFGDSGGSLALVPCER